MPWSFKADTNERDNAIYFGGTSYLGFSGTWLPTSTLIVGMLMLRCVELYETTLAFFFLFFITGKIIYCPLIIY